MRGLISLEDVIAALPKDRREKVEAMGAELVAKIRKRMTLAELRKGRKLSQAKMADALGIGQMQISRLEQRKDPRLSTMQRTVAAMGGHLTMIVTFPDQEPVVLVTSKPAKDERAAKSVKAKSKKTALRKRQA
jgi:transcriptional regulator with XRE-family HTH domain